jgi:O-antigen ligase
VSSLLIGGGTRAGFLSDAVLQLLAVPALLIALTSLMDLPTWRTTIKPNTSWALAFCFAIALVPLLQLIPLPPLIWTKLPGREAIVNVLSLVGDHLPWRPISVSPSATWVSFLSLLPPIAIFLSAIQLGYRERRQLSLVIIAIGILSAFLGLLQVAQGPNSSLRFFAITNSTEAVGFFANRNHFAALLYVVLLFAAAWAIDIGSRAASWTDLRSFDAATLLAVTAILVVFVVVIAGEAMARSRAGLIFTIISLMAIFALSFMDRRRTGTAGKQSKLLLAAILLAVTMSVQFALYRILDRFGSDPLENARVIFGRNTIHAAMAFMPFGAGLGTFVPVYQMFERPGDILANVYANHAHDDVLELCLETGIIGPILLLLFLAWVGFRAVTLWRRPPHDMGGFDYVLSWAAIVGVGLLIAHSVLDYPMRTGAMMAVFAICCALLFEPLRGTEGARNFEAAPSKSAAPHKLPAIAPGPSPLPAWIPTKGPATGNAVPATRPHQLPERWGDDVEWPEEWRKSGKPRGPRPPDAEPEPKPTAESEE